MEVSGPVSFQWIRGSFMSDFMLLSVFLSVYSADNLGLVKLRGCWKDSGFDFIIEFCQTESMEGT